MPQFFARHWNALSRLSLYGSPVALGLAGLAAALFVRSPYWTGARTQVEQPVPFSHELHSGQLELDCRYCHAAAETAAFGGMPATDVCMNCHAHVWTGLASLEPVRSSTQTDIPIAWVRVNDLPDHAHFHHGIHTQKGIGCSTCHGRVDRMPRVWQTESLYMEWCLDCHRNPEWYVRPRAEVFNMGWEPPADQTERGRELVEQYRIKRKTSCSTCHY